MAIWRRSLGVGLDFVLPRAWAEWAAVGWMLDLDCHKQGAMIQIEAHPWPVSGIQKIDSHSSLMSKSQN